MNKTEQPKICGAQLRKKPGSTCQKRPVKGKRRCRLHGGLSLKGVEHKNYTHGRYSKYLPTDLRGRFDESLHDPDLKSHEPDIRLIDTRLQTLLESLELLGRDNGEIWDKIMALIETRRRVLESETKRVLASQTSMSAEEALALVDFIFHILQTGIQKYVDVATRDQFIAFIATEFESLVSRTAHHETRKAPLLT
jgi:hypothetical protein